MTSDGRPDDLGPGALGPDAVVFTGGEYLTIPADLDGDARSRHVAFLRRCLSERMELRRRYEARRHPGLRVHESHISVDGDRVVSNMTLVAPA